MFKNIRHYRRGKLYQSFWKYKNDKDDYTVDYFQKLVGEKSPFNWRIGLALAMTDLEEKDRIKFLKSLETVLRQERYVIKNLKDNTKALKKIIKPFTPSKRHSEINRYGDLYKVHRIEPGSTKLETLRYVLSLSIDEFEKTNRPSKNSFSQIIRYFDQDDDPFDLGSFLMKRFKEIWKETIKKHLQKWNKRLGWAL